VCVYTVSEKLATLFTVLHKPHSLAMDKTTIFPLYTAARFQTNGLKPELRSISDDSNYCSEKGQAGQRMIRVNGLLFNSHHRENGILMLWGKHSAATAAVLYFITFRVCLCVSWNKT
jgi:hypothetical protein